MKSKIALVAALALVLVVPLFAQRPGGPGGPGGPGEPGEGPEFGARMVRFLTEVLDLTAAQVTSLEALIDAHSAAVRPLWEQRRDNRQQVKELLEGSNPDAAAVGRLVIAGHELAEQIRAARETLNGRIEALLTAEQKAAYQALKEARELRRHHRRGPGGPGGGFGPRR